MNYLNPLTLKVFLYLIYGNVSIDIPTNLRVEKENFIKDIFENKFQGFFTLIKNNEIFKEIDYENLLDKEYYDFSLLNKPLKIELIEENKDELTSLIYEYASNFKNDDLNSKNENFYSFNKCLIETINLLEPYYNDYGKNFNIDIALDKNQLGNKEYDNKIRLIESIFYFLNKKYITINCCNISNLKSDKDNKNIIFIGVTLNKTFDEILDIEEYWNYGYGDIRINEKDGVAFYKTNRYPAKSTDTKAFKLLCNLVKNHGTKVSIEDDYNLFWTDSDKISFNKKKSAIYGLLILQHLFLFEDNLRNNRCIYSFCINISY